MQPDSNTWFLATSLSMPLVALLGVFGIVASAVLPIVSFRKGRPGPAALSALLLVGLGACILGGSLSARSTELLSLEKALPFANPVDRASIQVGGAGHARAFVAAGMLLALLPLASACLCLGRALTGRVSRLAVGGGLVLALGIAIGCGAIASREVRLMEGEAMQAGALIEDRPRISVQAGAEAARRGRVAWLAGPFALGGAALLVAGRRRSRSEAPVSEG